MANVQFVNRIFNQPCGSLREIPDESVDVVVTSPPYNRSQKRPAKNKKVNLVGYGDYDDRRPDAEYERMIIDAVNGCMRVLRPTGSMFIVYQSRSVKQHERTPFEWLFKCDCELYQTIIWNRGSTHKLEPSYLRPIFEYVLHIKKPGAKPRINRACSAWTNIWSINWSETRHNPHPAPFPCELVQRCLRLADAQPGELVLDPFLGSATTAVVATYEGLNYLGYEISSRYIEIAQKRLVPARIERRIWDEGIDGAGTGDCQRRKCG